MVSTSRRAIVDRLADYDRLLEVGIGDRAEVARALVDSPSVSSVTAVDVHERSVPSGVEFVREDVVEVARSIDRSSSPSALPAHYRVEAIYGLRLPAELQRPAAAIAAHAGAFLLFTTLGFEEPIIAVERERVGRSVLYVRASSR